ncbi:MAG: hypothetical protein MPEBLZ_02979 [Candidatus Methanoperedens nitroreducens]|uniref:Uncharacterized protein n=1 Tax=Candidatus Methanoperedens nitratireducens TaxID=1392998 RepID=A0A0P8CI58_9EURY|nr:hypothetical protein [Candidatus Methanoperedens sp. BLZ2]KAB2940482.1 MAG: hypothetical protein F9K14_19315 [Candidatus Methanoperedens sp.]KPQ42469.1 MAG: hypothetical protein MPEBLZ_02979 [Candidatus Methanoperedens sp. BLZ1]MBZ0176811.1 hypothetical protein [Candidatus Methanoperedens nitroreducens]CAG0971529.1 hypothetical protein METP2_01426 [Methanosarcinales archaeon]MCX9080533.1 hypothetical protein [Candidatus Methanoperedens sp.]
MVKGIEQKQNDEVEQIEIKIIRLSRIGSNDQVVLLGENNKEVIAPVQIIKSLVDRREFRPWELNNFLEGKINSVVPIQPFIAYPVINKTTGLCYLITFEKIIPTTPEFIDAQMYGRPYSIPSVIKFGLGTYRIKTKNNLPVTVNLGNFSNNSSIRFEGLNINRKFGHTAKPVHSLIKILRDIAELDAQNDFKTPEELLKALNKRL